jgi:hypothetical protein
MPAGNTYEAIATQTLVNDTTTVTFSSIPQTYTDLIIVSSAQSTQSGSSINNLRGTFNSDTGGNYSATYLYGDGSAAGSIRETNLAIMPLGNMTQTSATYQTLNIIHIMNYSNTTTYKTVLVRDNSASVQVEATVGLWRNTSAITQISLARGTSPNIIKAGSTFSLYGIKSA